MPVLMDRLTGEDILFAAIAALVITWLITRIGKVVKFTIINPKSFTYKSKDFNKIFERCCLLFPNQTIRFKGKIFTRGMMVKVTTVQNKIFSGKLVGTNKENFICLISNDEIAADTIDNIKEMTTVADDSSVDRLV